MVEQPQQEGAGTGAELWQSTLRRLTWAAVAANGLGGLFLFLLLGFLIPFAPDGPDRQVGLNAAVGAAYLVTTLYLGKVWSVRASRPVRDWLAEGRRPTPEERRLVLGQPLRFAYTSGVFWTIGAVLFTLLNAPTSGWSALVVGGALLLGGETTCAVGYLLAERIVRPVTALALAGGAPPGSIGPGVSGRLTMAWSLGTGVPLLGILVIATAGLAQGDVDPALLAGAVAFLAALGLAVGMFVMTVASRSIAEPLAAVRRGIARIEEGELDVSVPVDDGSEVGLLEAGFNRMTRGLAERERLRVAFGAFVDPSLAERVLEEGTDFAGEEVEVSLLFVDVRDFTGYSERVGPHDVVASLNALYERIVPIVIERGGHANKFIGDGLLAVFGAPARLDDHADRAVAAALEIGALNGRPGTVELRVGVGVNSGEVVAGTIGGGGRLDFTVIGDAVNTAARVEAATRKTGDDVLITAATRDLLATDHGEWAERDPVPMKGKSEPVRLFAPAARPRSR